MILFWVDDCIFYAKHKKQIDDIIHSLKDEFLLEKEEDIDGFLGIKISRDDQERTITLTQTDLIDQILDVMRLENSNIKFTPADKVPLHKDECGSPCIENWNYISVVGMLLYFIYMAHTEYC